MKHEKRVIDAFKLNAIDRILLVDDAYDPPKLDEQMVAAYADFLEGEAGRTACSAHSIEQHIIDAAASAAVEGNLESEDLETVHRVLYAVFAQTGQGLDPGGRFDLLKGPTLENLRPLYALLKKCGSAIEVRTSGRLDCDQRYREFRPQVLFVDYYLGEDVPPAGSVSPHKKTQARKASIEFLQDVVASATEDPVPAIVLMSSHQVTNVDQYRHNAGNWQIMSLRFHYLNKNHVRLEEHTLEIDHDAADALLDTSQGYLFGTLVQDALAQWKKGAESAFHSLIREMADLHIKDFAYLMRFRLHDEGQPLSDYLEWLLGECLKGLISENVDWGHDSFQKLNSPDKLEENIEGAFDGPTLRVAELFHRVRVDERSCRPRNGLQLGDLYAQPKGSNIRAIVTPDCDLVVRRGKTKVKSILTMGGTLHSFGDDGTSADDLFLRGKTPYSVRWNPKDLETFPIKGKDSLAETHDLRFVGTLRPLYAQEMQRRALTDLSRVGLPVAPALGLNARATVWVRTIDASNPFQQIDMDSPPPATIIPARTGQRYGHRVLLHRRFFNELIDRLVAFDRNTLSEEDLGSLRSILDGEGIDALQKGWLRTGRMAKERGIFGTGFVLGDRPNTKQDAPWLQVVLQMADKTMEELRLIDPIESGRLEPE